jgi:cation diffusion facilitator CzcD-associated flavoprotein CzcO
MIQETNTLIIGASVAGLASAACLGVENIDYIIVEKHAEVVTPWRNHYERLHLHTNKNLSHLPYKKFNPAIPLYPSRMQVVEYMDSYQREFDIKPQFNTEAKSIVREGEYWITETSNGKIKSKNLIMATGAYGLPRRIDFKGMETFPGKIIHSSQFKNALEFKGKKVLVIGFGNSACEIAINLHEQGASPALAVRSAVNVLPRDIFGIPVLQLGLLMSNFPPRFADKMNAPLIRFLTGDIQKLGLRKLPYGPLEQMQKDQSVPLLDIGTLKLIREGHCAVYDDIERIEGKTVIFKSGRKAEFDAIVAAIGFNKGYEQNLLQVERERFEDLSVGTSKQKYFGKDGLYFCGFYVSPTGQIREIGIDAKKIAKSIVKKSGAVK